MGGGAGVSVCEHRSSGLEHEWGGGRGCPPGPPVGPARAQLRGSPSVYYAKSGRTGESTWERVREGHAAPSPRGSPQRLGALSPAPSEGPQVPGGRAHESPGRGHACAPPGAPPGHAHASDPGAACPSDGLRGDPALGFVSPTPEHSSQAHSRGVPPGPLQGPAHSSQTCGPVPRPPSLGVHRCRPVLGFWSSIARAVPLGDGRAGEGSPVLGWAQCGGRGLAGSSSCLGAETPSPRWGQARRP